MRPRSYSVLNRSIARGITYALRDNRRKYKSNKYKNTYIKPNNTAKATQINNTGGNELVICWIIAILFILVGLAVIFPMIMWL